MIERHVLHMERVSWMALHIHKKGCKPCMWAARVLRAKDDLFKEIVDHTIYDDKNDLFITDFWTCMMNNHADFSQSAAFFWLALSVNPNQGVTVINSKIENDY